MSLAVTIGKPPPPPTDEGMENRGGGEGVLLSLFSLKGYVLR